MKNYKLIFFLFLINLPHFCFPQQTDSTKSISHFSGSISITHNGISLIPTFSLEKPAVQFNLSIGNGKLSFEPDIRFALEGKPWSFLFWFRYKLISSGRFRLNIGAHPALNFRTMRLPVGGDSSDVILARRFLAAEIVPAYQLSPKVSIGMYYLTSRGFDINVPKTTHFITLNSTISGISLPGQLHFRLNPQVYYLRQDRRDGLYFTSTTTLARRNFPLSVSAIINKKIRSNITGSKDFVWNASLIYSFNKKYVQQ